MLFYVGPFAAGLSHNFIESEKESKSVHCWKCFELGHKRKIPFVRKQTTQAASNEREMMKQDNDNDLALLRVAEIMVAMMMDGADQSDGDGLSNDLDGRCYDGAFGADDDDCGDDNDIDDDDGATDDADADALSLLKGKLMTMMKLMKMLLIMMILTMMMMTEVKKIAM